jgi:hypothetical protein
VQQEAVLHVVHCIDTEGPLDEDISATFDRVNRLFGLDLAPSRQTLHALQNRQIDLGGIEAEVAKVVAPELLAYNRDWSDINAMLADALSDGFRRQMVDDFGGGWVYSWHCVDHLGFSENPRRKDIGYGNIFRFYRSILAETGSTRDEINWHFHPLSITRRPLAAATSFAGSMDVLLYILARRVIDDGWFPTTSRPGFHAVRPDKHAFMEQWIPFDYASQAITQSPQIQKDQQMGRFGDWSRAPITWQGYHPHHDDHQSPGAARRWIFRCLNLGTRLRLLTEDDTALAFEEARQTGSAIIAYADHDYRDIRPNVTEMRRQLHKLRAAYPDVKIRFNGAEAAAQAHVAVTEPQRIAKPPVFHLQREAERVHVRLVDGTIFGPQPFLALQTRDGRYFHDNLDEVVKGSQWTYVMDDQTLPPSALARVGVAAAGASGGYGVARLEIDP